MRCSNDVAVKASSHPLTSAPRSWATVTLAALLAAFLAACGGPGGPGGGGGGGVGFVPVDDQVISQGLEQKRTLEISVRPNASQYTVTIRSDNPVLVPSSAIELSGLGADWFLTITPPPEQSGTALLTAELRAVSAPSNVIATESFRLTVNPISRTLPQHELIPTGLTERADLGVAVALDGNTLVVGANEEGAAYVFTRSGTEWVQTARLSSDDAGSTSYPFGGSVAISGDTIIVGSAFTTTAAGSTAGAAYVFTRSGTTWSQTNKLESPAPQRDANLGSAVAIDGGTIVLGAPGTEVDEVQTGAVYVYRD